MRAGANLGSVKSQNRWNAVDGSLAEVWIPIALWSSREYVCRLTRENLSFDYEPPFVKKFGSQ